VSLILDGKALAQMVREDVRRSVADLRKQGIVPRLQVALVGEYPPSLIYIGSKEKACAEAGIETATARLPGTTTQDELLRLVSEWNQDRRVHGILVQLPLPEQISADAILAAIDPSKDVDGLNPTNLGRIITSEPFCYPATPSGILEILSHYGIMLSGKHLVIVGRGELIGKPLANMALRKSVGGSPTVTVCHSQTADLGYFTRQADVLVAAVGRPSLIRADMVKQGVVVIDAGTNRVATETGNKLVGDVAFAEVAPLASAITPVPGGVGPMTVAMLLKNTVKAAKSHST
jgi:methylenetetrahydrofolate dehydrogenase (NADP+)/methenyltetrahydrofolate cyclohydrolase